MKTIITMMLATFIAYSVSAQVEPVEIVKPAEPIEAVQENTMNDEFDTLIDSMKQTPIEQVSKIKNEKQDTVHIRVGKHAVEIVSGGDNTYIDIEKIEDFESKWDSKKNNQDKPEVIINNKPHKKHRKKFDGHWGGMDFGGNQLWDTDYSLYAEGTPEFLTTMPEKSFEVNLNFAEYSFGFCSYFGFVTGLGLNFNDYKFKNRYSITKDESGMIQPITLPDGDFRKSKISTLYLQAPMMLEFQIPGQYDHKRMFIAGGVIGGLKLSEHTKYKIGSQKNKDKGDHNIAPVRWGYTAKIGFEDVGIYATYYNTKFFEEGKGPATTPITVGITWSFD